MISGRDWFDIDYSNPLWLNKWLFLLFDCRLEIIILLPCEKRRTTNYIVSVCFFSCSVFKISLSVVKRHSEFCWSSQSSHATMYYFDCSFFCIPSIAEIKLFCLQRPYVLMLFLWVWYQKYSFNAFLRHTDWCDLYLHHSKMHSINNFLEKSALLLIWKRSSFIGCRTKNHDI